MNVGYGKVSIKEKKVWYYIAMMEIEIFFLDQTRTWLTKIFQLSNRKTVIFFDTAVLPKAWNGKSSHLHLSCQKCLGADMIELRDGVKLHNTVSKEV